MPFVSEMPYLSSSVGPRKGSNSNSEETHMKFTKGLGLLLAALAVLAIPTLKTNAALSDLPNPGPHDLPNPGPHDLPNPGPH